MTSSWFKEHQPFLESEKEDLRQMEQNIKVRICLDYGSYDHLSTVQHHFELNTWDKWLNDVLVKKDLTGPDSEEF